MDAGGVPVRAGRGVLSKDARELRDSVWEIFGPASGVLLVIVPDENAQDPYRLIDALERHRVTRIVLVPRSSVRSSKRT